jgi:hypothetical protein
LVRRKERHYSGLLGESMMEEMKHEYHEGPKAGENFVKLARAVF